MHESTTQFVGEKNYEADNHSQRLTLWLGAELACTNFIYMKFNTIQPHCPVFFKFLPFFPWNHVWYTKHNNNIKKDIKKGSNKHSNYQYITVLLSAAAKWLILAAGIRNVTWNENKNWKGTKCFIKHNRNVNKITIPFFSIPVWFQISTA